MSEKISHDSLKPEIAKQIEEITGWKQTQEGSLKDREQPDIHFYCNGYELILELGIGAKMSLYEKIPQAEGYKEETNSDGIIALVYPEEVRKEITGPEVVEKAAANTSLDVLVLSPFLKTYERDIKLPDLGEKLRETIQQPTPQPDLNTVVEAIQEAVQTIGVELRRETDLQSPIVKEVIGNFDLFKIISEGEAGDELKQEEMKLAATDLASYILVNQVLLYHIVSTELEGEKLPTLEGVEDVEELQTQYFSLITEINYDPIYALDVVSTAPETMLDSLNKMISTIRALQPEKIRHDLIGKIFHDLLPNETQKLLASFYTKPVAGEFLAQLAVDCADDKVLDPACGSGTLLVSSYRTKRRLDQSKGHHSIVEQELTGVDVMPFAAHLSALNLTVQAPKEKTNEVRVGINNSLTLKPGDRTTDVGKAQRSLGNSMREPERYQSTDIVELGSGRSGDFELEEVDLVIMNPPFTRQERLTDEMKPEGELREWFGEQNYWVYFIGLTEYFLNEGGKVAAVLPMDFFRGKHSKSIRKWLFSEHGQNYRLKYIVKTVNDIAFSEQSKYRDFLIVLEKTRSKEENNQFSLVYLKPKLEELNLNQVKNITTKVRESTEGEFYEDEDVAITWTDHSDVRKYLDNMWPIVGFLSPSTQKTMVNFYNRSLDLAEDKLIKSGNLLESDEIIRGYEPSSGGIRDIVWIVRELCEERMGRTKLLVGSGGDTHLEAVFKDSTGSVDIDKSNTFKGLKTHSYVSQFDISNKSDYLVVDDFDANNDLYTALKEEVSFENVYSRASARRGYFCVARRPDLSASGTRLLAFYSDDLFVPSDMFWVVKVDPVPAKELTVWMNSIIGISNMLLWRKETRGSFSQIDKHNLEDFYLLNPDKLTKEESKELLAVFEELRDNSWPSLIQQLQNQSSQRKLMDKQVLKILGFSKDEISSLLPRLYEKSHKELKSLKEAMN